MIRLNEIASRGRAGHFLVGLILFEAGENLHLLVRRAKRSPGYRFFDHALVGTEPRLGKPRRDMTDHPPLFLESPDGVDHQTAELDDRNVARAETLLGSIGDDPHRFPHRDVLVWNAGDAGKTAMLHRRTVLKIIVVGVTLDGAEMRIDILADDQHAELPPCVGIDAGLLALGPGDEVEVTAGVVARHDHARDIISTVGRDQRRKRRDKRRDANVIMRIRVHDRTPDGGISHAVIGELNLNPWVLVGRGTDPVISLCRRIALGGPHVGRMQRGGMRRVDLSLHDLCPIAGKLDLRNRDPRLSMRSPGRRLEFRHRLLWPHIGPDEPAGLARGVGKMFCLFGQSACLRLRRHVDDSAFGVELPAVIEAAHAALFVAPESERRLAVRTGLPEQAELSVAVTKRNELLAEELDPHRRTVRPRHLFRQNRRHPMTPHQAAHRGVPFDPAQQFVFDSCQHARSPLKQLRAVRRTTYAGSKLSLLSLYILRRPAPSRGVAKAPGQRTGAADLRRCGLHSFRREEPRRPMTNWRFRAAEQAGGGGRTRTFEAMRRLIYSQLPLPLGTLPRSTTSRTLPPKWRRSGHG